VFIGTRRVLAKQKIIVLPRWPSFAVFTDPHLKPSYVEAQRFRVDSADICGSYITIAR
jgi:hypothetical protein